MVETTDIQNNFQTTSKQKSFRTAIGRNRILLLNIFKYVEFKRKALLKLGQTCVKYSVFVKKDMTLFEMFEKEK